MPLIPGCRYRHRGSRRRRRGAGGCVQGLVTVKCHGQVCVDGIFGHLACVGVDAAGQVNCQHKCAVFPLAVYQCAGGQPTGADCRGTRYRTGHLPRRQRAVPSRLQRHGITLDEDEIAYIALHLGGALETQKELANRVPAVLYCPSYYNNGQQPGRTASVQPSRASTGWILPQRARIRGCICCVRISVSRRKIHTPSVTATTMPPCSVRRRTPI